MVKVRNVFITGCNRGIGLELVKQILELYHPDHLFATCRDSSKATGLNEIASNNSNLHVLNFDVTDTTKYAQIVTEVTQITGEYGINLLINNAGICSYPTQIGSSVTDLDRSSLLSFIETNTLAPIFLTKALLPLLEKASARDSTSKLGVEKSVVLNVSSIAGSISEGTGEWVCYYYQTSKAALNMATRCLSMELKNKGILTAILHPGWVQTDMGGPLAPITVTESVSKTLATLQALGESDNGRFLDMDGKDVPW